MDIFLLLIRPPESGVPLRRPLDEAVQVKPHRTVTVLHRRYDDFAWLLAGERAAHQALKPKVGCVFDALGHLIAQHGGMWSASNVEAR